jgi:hypothetical protein
MKIVIVLAAAVLLLGLAPEVVAEKLVVHVKPGTTIAAEGISVRTERRDDGHIEFTIRRDPAKAEYHDRGATLQVNGPAGLIAEKKKGTQLFFRVLMCENELRPLFLFELPLSVKYLLRHTGSRERFPCGRRWSDSS